MIIQCEQCQAKFRLDDSKVTVNGVKVRCAKCKHVFTVSKEQPEPEPVDFGSSFEQTTTNWQEDEVSFPATPEQQSEAQEPFSQFSFNSDSAEEADSSVKMEFEAIASDSPFTADANDEFSLSSLEGDGSDVDQAGAPSAQGVVDFDGFDFGDGGTDSIETVQAPPSANFGDKSVEVPVFATEEETAGLDFSEDDLFGAVISPPVEEPADSISFDFGTDSFADSMEIGGAEAGRNSSSLELDNAADEPFSFGEIDFGDELTSVAVQQVNPEELKPSQEMLFSPLAGVQEKRVVEDNLQKAFLIDSGRSGQDDLPPLSITSRRKQSPLFTGLIVALAILVVGALGYLGLTSFPADNGKPAQENGKIGVIAVKASYVKNVLAGTLLVLSGEAVNEYPKPRAALQVKGVIFDAAGRILSSKTAFVGNPLTNEQLASLPLDKIEVAMANQFGDSLANLEVAPGKSVPFTIVIANPPLEGMNFGVESAGSTVAAGKQQ